VWWKGSRKQPLQGAVSAASSQVLSSAYRYGLVVEALLKSHLLSGQELGYIHDACPGNSLQHYHAPVESAVSTFGLAEISVSSNAFL